MNHNRILVVDDDADDQFIFIDAINEIAMDIECLTANNGLEALAHLNDTVPQPSIIFLDLNMPLMNGFECLGRIKNDENLKKIPVVIISTSDSPLDKKRTKELGAEIFLTKTPDFNRLKSTLIDILNKKF